MRRTESSEKFVKIAARFSWGLAVAAGLLLYIADYPEAWAETAMMKPAAFASIVMIALGFQLYTSIVAIWGRFLGTLLLILAPMVLSFSGLPEGHSFLSGALNTYSSGLLLGGFFAGQFLGHWYLNVPGMHIIELKRIMKFLFLGLGIKTLEIMVSLGLRASGGSGSGIDTMGRPLGDDVSNTEYLLQLNPSHSIFSFEGDMWFGLGSYGLILLSMRVIWGVIAPWVLALMINKTVNMRSTQSATGILYAACVMVLIAEATALYLGQVLGINL